MTLLKHIAILIGLSLWTVASAQPGLQSQMCLGGTQDEFAHAAIVTSDGGAISVGNTYSEDGDVGPTHGQMDLWIVKTDASGAVQWQRCLGGSDYENAFSVIQTNDGGYAVIGFTGSINGDVDSPTWGDWDVWLIRLDANGTLLWERAYGGSGSDSGMSIVETADGGFTLLGTTWSSDGQITSSQGGQDLWLVHVDSDRVLEWQRTYGGTSTDYGRSVAIAAGGGYYIAGMTYSNDGDVTGNHGGQDIWVARLNEAGDIQWSRAYGSTGEEEAREVIALADGGAVFAGKTSANNGDVVGAHGVDDGWVVRVDETGSIVWQRPLGGTYSEIIEAISIGLNGEILCAGNAGSHNGDVVGHHGNGIELDAWAVALDPSTGTLLWQRCLGGTDNDYGADIDVRSDGAFMVLGTLDSEDGDVTCGHGAFDFWLVGLSPFTGVSDLVASSSEPRLTAWPVPASEHVHLRVDGRSGTHHVLEIYDAQGHTVHRTVLTPSMDGAVEWDLRDQTGDPVPAGLFYARVQGQVCSAVRLIVAR